ncbi:serine--tRNA ligase [Candidatus Woesearchaeota archaeon]|nr:MAG: serine--tRNA ligase [Candidatus Woesearchaeota archaeon]
MLDIKLIRTNPELVRENLKRRKNPEYEKMLDRAIELDSEWRRKNMEREKLRARRNAVSKEIAKLKREGGSSGEVEKLMAEAKEIPKRIEEVENESERMRNELRKILMRLPNLLHESVPEGEDEEDNEVVKEWGKKTKHEFSVVSHPDLLEQLGMADFQQAAKVAGARFYYLMGDIVRVELALQQFALEKLAKKGYTTVAPPHMLRREPYEGVTSLDDFEDVLYKIEGEDLYMIATSEHPLAALHMGQTINEKNLPLKYAGISPCYRKEAGSHGKDTKGIFRVHHFNKIEQFIFCKPEDSWKYHEELLQNAEEIFQELGLPYRVVNICTGDIGTVAAKKYDLEIWMPAQEKYREAVSCSNCTDYQARRLNIRWTDGKNRDFLHTLNSTAIATSRVLVGILENFQNKDGTVDIPEALWPYLGGTKKLVAKNATEHS